MGRRTVASALLISTLFVASVAAAPEAGAATTSEKQMAGLINQARRHYGRSNLQLGPNLTKLARAHSYAMARKRTIFHSNNLAYKLRYYTWRVAGENVGMGPTMIALHQAFMASPHHKANVLYRGYHRFGVGVIWRDHIAYITVIFIG